MPDVVAEAHSRVVTRLAELDSAIVAFSGGVDSSLVAALAARALGPSALAVTAVSPSLAAGELEAARAVADAVGIAHETVTTEELSRDGYRRNLRDRCYHCKTELYEALRALANTRGYGWVLSGANADDLGDWRPGLRAAAENGVVHPLLEANVDKATVRALAARLRVPSASKPASPCLSSRVPYGTRIEVNTLRQIDRAERAVRALGYAELRVRHFGGRARVELPETDMSRAMQPAARRAICDAVRSAGYASVRIDPRPFRSGALNREHVQPR